MKDKQKLKVWLRSNYSCIECNKELFLFQETNGEELIKTTFHVFYSVGERSNPNDESDSFQKKDAKLATKNLKETNRFLVD